MDAARRPIVIYHNNCTDGFTAAWVFHHHYRKLGGCDFHPGRYGDQPPDVSSRLVYLVDFSYPREVVAEMVKKAYKVVLLDHHKTAIDDLKGLEGLDDQSDLERSGATLAWDYCFQDVPRPAMLNAVEDRDLWRFKLTHTKEMMSFLQSMDFTFENWDSIMLHDDAASISGMTAMGQAIARKVSKDVKEIARGARQRVALGHKVPVVNCPSMFASDVLHLLARGEKFAISWWEASDVTVYSLRSDPDGLDVSELAKAWGGGGHKHAAGFKVKHGDARPWA